MNGKSSYWMTLALCVGAQALLASNLYFSINDDANKYWDHAPGWKEEYRIPTADDNVSFNSMYLDVGARGATPLQITNGVDAVCRVFQIATSGKGSGSSYQDDGRIIGVKMTGGTLTTRNKDDFNWWEEFTVGHNAAGYGRFEMTGGELRPYHGAVGVAGIGVFTNNGGRVVMQGLPGTSCFAVGLQKGAQGRLAMLDGLFTTAVSTNDGCFISVGGSGTGTLDMEGGVISNIIVSMGTGNAGLGTLNMQGGDIYKFIRIGAGTTATGVVNMTGGTIHNNGSAGYSSYGILNLTNGTITGSLYVGNRATSTGQVFMAGGKIGGVLYVGQNGKGLFDFSGGELTGNDIRLGAEEGSDGRMILRWPLYINNVYAGLDGYGELNVQTNMTINYLKIGSSTKAFGRVNVSSNCTLGIQTQICAGGSTLPGGVKGDQQDVGGCGEVVLNGGTIKFTNSGASAPNLFLGRYAAKFPGTFGVLRGYGSISPSGSGATNVRMAIGVGQVIADGAGENRTLDLNEVVNVTNSVPTGPADSNGWYAVNQGCVLFPRTWYGSGTSFSRCFGDAPYETRPGLVNSLYFTVTQSSQANNYFRGGVYATDRTDLHLETLPLNNGIVSCWKLGLFDGVIGTGKRNFTKISLTFRYDVAKAPKNSRFSLWRHDGTGWQRVGRAVYTEGEIPLISTSSELTPGSETFNVGIFAVTADKVGMTIIFR